MHWISLVMTASHFSMVGFPVSVSDAEAMGAYLTAHVQGCELIKLQGEDHLCIVRDKSGAELWIGLKKHGETVEAAAFNPAFDGEGEVDVLVNGDVSDAEWKPFEVRIQARLAGEVPFVFDLADPREAPRFSPEAKLMVEITAFADEIALHESEAAYDASQAGREVAFASTYFIPSGMFAVGTEGASGPTAHAAFAGKILKSELRQNEAGRARYWWFLVETFGGAVFDVVADPEMVKETPKVGGYLDGSFWLSARLTSP